MGQRAAARKPYWQVFQGENGWWYIHLKGTNHKTIVTGGGYDTEANARQAVQWVRANASTADGP
jgi:uncharacterized protein YegP (UPF0339 family)